MTEQHGVIVLRADWEGDQELRPLASIHSSRQKGSSPHPRGGTEGLAATRSCPMALMWLHFPFP